jgi:two-component system sensor histidine kinase KdpD
MELVVSNILENAARYSPDGSPIDVTLRGEGRKVVLDVADRGKGIPARHRERIFEKFYRIGDGGTGTGLGLSICKAVTEAHGGTVEALPREGGGTVFRVTLPAGEEGAP